MNTRQLIAAGAMALMLSQASFAATKPDRCTALENKFDKRATTSTSTNLDKAKTLRADGGKLCSEGNSAEGTKKLQQAVKMLGSPTKK